MKTLQKTGGRAFQGVGRNDSATWKNIFDFLRRGADEVRGRSDSGTHDLRRKIEQFANGNVPPEQLEKFCEEFSASPEVMEMLARALKNPPVSQPE